MQTDLVIFQWNIWCFYHLIPHQCEIHCCLQICRHQVDWSFDHPHIKIQYIIYFCWEQESISILIHEMGWGWNFYAQACFHGLFLFTLCITWSTSFEDPHFLTSIYQLEYPSEINSVFLQGNFSFHKLHIPFFGEWYDYCCWSH